MYSRNNPLSINNKQKLGGNLIEERKKSKEPKKTDLEKLLEKRAEIEKEIQKLKEKRKKIIEQEMEVRKNA